MASSCYLSMVSDAEQILRSNYGLISPRAPFLIWHPEIATLVNFSGKGLEVKDAWMKLYSIALVGGSRITLH